MSEKSDERCETTVNCAKRERLLEIIKTQSFVRYKQMIDDGSCPEINKDGKDCPKRTEYLIKLFIRSYRPN